MTETGNGSPEKKEDRQECENYKFAITELRMNYVFKTLRYVATLAFAAALTIAFHSYILCALSFILMLLLL